MSEQHWNQPASWRNYEEGTPVVWIVDDSPAQGAWLRKVLAERHSVVLFDHAAPMLERLALGQRPDLVVLDWDMPDISGVEACSTIRQIAGPTELPVIFLTALGEHEDLLTGLAAGANDFMRKPGNQAEIEARIATLVHARRLHMQLLRVESELRAEALFRERFLAMLAHDLRQPLGIFVLGSETIAAEDTPQPVRQKVRLQFGRAAARMQRMIGELLDFSRSRPQGGGMSISPRSMDFSVVVAEVVAEVQLAHPARVVAFDAAGDCRGNWDADRLAQVVSNLVENALRHSAAKSPVAVSLDASGNVVRLRVENQGPPIPAEVRAALFEPFRSSAAPRAPGDRGLGLGLYIVEQIAKAHSGSVQVDCFDGQIRFDVTLPTGPQHAL